jgi:hypothetical protein
MELGNVFGETEEVLSSHHNQSKEAEGRVKSEHQETLITAG